MKKELPKVYANRIDKKIENNKKIDYAGLNNKEEKIEISKIEQAINNSKKNINQKLNDIFNSSKYVYKADVEIKLKDKTIIKKIIGQNQSHLITIDNELIPIADIIDISFTK